jgi:hypothetical protein
VDEVEAPFALDNRTRLEGFAAVEEGDTGHVIRVDDTMVW